MRGVTFQSFVCSVAIFISTHTPHARRDTVIFGVLFSLLFISTHTPHARRDQRSNIYSSAYWNFNSHASCEAWQIYIWSPWLHLHFNSHASCEAWPIVEIVVGVGTPNFNSHASCEAWPSSPLISSRAAEFQLTRLMRGVTTSPIRPVASVRISTHTPHARRDNIYNWCRIIFWISTHTPHARRDTIYIFNTDIFQFQLTRLMRGVTFWE